MAPADSNDVYFSIITPVRNAAATVQRTIDSVQRQSVDCEHLVLDAGSTDGTLELLRPFIDRFAYFRSHPDDGIAAAFNEGIEHARGRYLIFLNADDYLLPDALASVRRFVEASTAAPDIVYGDAMILDAAGHTFLERARLEALPAYMSLYHPSMYFRREALHGLGGYDGRYSLAMDSELTHRALAAGCTFAHLPEPLAVMSRGGLSDRHHWRSLNQYRRSVRQHRMCGWLPSAWYLLRQAAVHEALKLPSIKRWRLSRRDRADARV
jgi:glycosyltransferase involved in cell wall biosynthesis